MEIKPDRGQFLACSGFSCDFNSTRENTMPEREKTKPKTKKTSIAKKKNLEFPNADGHDCLHVSKQTNARKRLFVKDIYPYLFAQDDPE